MADEVLKIRQATIEDVSAIRALTREAYAKWVPVIGREPLPMSADYLAAIKSHRFDLLHTDGELVALIETVSGPNYLLIENVAVSPTFQGRGLGRRLLAHAEVLAASLNHIEIKLYTNKLFNYNINFYYSLGYQTYYEENLMGGIRVHMSKTI